MPSLSSLPGQYRSGGQTAQMYAFVLSKQLPVLY